MRSIPGGVYVFADIDRLSTENRKKAGDWYQLIKEAGGTVLNDPLRFVGRLELLQALHQSGFNQFSAYGLGEHDLARFPLFLRYRDGHDGNESDLIHEPATLELEIAKLKAKKNGRQLIAVEFLDYKEQDEHFYKYSHFRVGERLIFGGMVCGSTWCRKLADNLASATVDREIRASSEIKYDKPLMHCFETAQIDFGRIDYAIVDGEVQVFEINSNPDIGISCPLGMERWKIRSRCYQQINEAFWELFRASNRESSIETPGSFDAASFVQELVTWPRLCAKAMRKARQPGG
ncbi:MAG: hypothetical protein GY768_18425 [Planctomycetaceae bacterium]|nr:hypothetical protein [Planctomycetaceae bacterium]